MPGSTPAAARRSDIGARRTADTPAISPDEEARLVDHVAADGVQRADDPGRRRRVHAPVLRVAEAGLEHLAELALLDHRPRQPDRGQEAVVEAGEVLDATGLGGPPQALAIGGAQGQRLLAGDVLAGLDRRERRLDVQRVGPDVVEHVDTRVAGERAPVGGVAVEAVADRRLAHPRLAAPGDRRQLGAHGAGPEHVRDGPEGVHVRLRDAAGAEHADAQRRTVVRRGGRVAVHAVHAVTSR